MIYFAERKARAVTDAAISWLDKIQGSKFLLWAHYFDTHARYQPPGTVATPKTQGDLVRFHNMEITYADSQLGRLLSRVQEIQAETGRETLIFMTADHGEALSGHNEVTHGIFVYDDTIHVPLIVVDSSRSDQGKRVGRPVSIVDDQSSSFSFDGP